MEPQIKYVEVRKLFARVPADVFSDLERFGMMREIDRLISDFLSAEIERRREEELRHGRRSQ